MNLRYAGMLRAAFVAIVLSMLTSPGWPAATWTHEPRIALIIANASYSRINQLPGVQRDAESMRSALTTAGFSVSIVPNTTSKAQMMDALNRFADQLLLSGGKAIGVLYYAGHGAVDRHRGDVYLIPTNYDPGDRSGLSGQAVADSEVLDRLESTHAKAVVVIFDSCRTRVLIGSADAQTVAQDAGGSRQLALPNIETWGARRTRAPPSAEAPSPNHSAQISVVYSADPGNVASDDGVFATTLANAIKQPGANSNTALEATQAYVRDHSSQAPHLDMAISPPFVFTPTVQDLLQGVVDVIHVTNWNDENDRANGMRRLSELTSGFQGQFDRADINNIMCDPSVASAPKTYLRSLGAKCR